MRQSTRNLIGLASLALVPLLMLGACSEEEKVMGPSPAPVTPMECSITAIQTGSGASARQVTCSASATGGNSPYEFMWSFGDTHSSSGASTSHTYSANGDYRVTLTVTDDAGTTCSNDSVININTTNSLQCQSSASVTSGTAPLVVQFSCSASGGNSPYQYTWTFGDGGSSSQQSPSHTFSTAGAYTVRVTVRDGSGATVQDTKTIAVQSATSTLACSASASRISGVAPLAVAFSGGATGGTAPYSYRWQFGDGGQGTGRSVSHTYSSAGSYTATLTVTDANSDVCQKSISITVTPPTSALTCQASATVTSGTAPLSTQFSCTASGGTTPYQYSWTFGDGATSSSRTPSHTYTLAGTYTATVTVRDASGASKQSSVVISVTAAPSALECSASASPTSGTVPLPVSFSGSATGGRAPYSYWWQFGDGGSSTQSSPSHTYQSGGSYTASLQVTDAAGDVCQKSVTISVSQPPSGPTLTGPSSVTAGQSFSLNWSYSWPWLATTGEKIVLERSTTSATSGFSQVAEIARGGSSHFVVVNPTAGTYWFRARVRVGSAGRLVWSAYSSVVKVTVSNPVSRTRFNNTGTYFIVSLKVDGVEQFTSSPNGLPSGYYYEMQLSPGTHSYVALLGFWNEYDQREYMYSVSGTFTQRVGMTEAVTISGPTINDLLTKFKPTGVWSAWIPGQFVKAIYKFYADGTYDFYVGTEHRASGNYQALSRDPATWSINFTDGNVQGVLWETLGYFVMYNGPNGAALQYFYDGQQ